MSDSNIQTNLRQNVFPGALEDLPVDVPAGNSVALLGRPLEVQKLYCGVMVHELNNFLQCIQNGIDLAKAELQESNGEVDALLDDCSKASHNSICLLRNYSMLLKGEAGYSECKKVDVVDIARKSAKMLLRDSKINFLFGMDNSVEYVLGDETQLYQLFHNLLKNAKEAILDKGNTIRIDISRKIIGKGAFEDLLPGEYTQIKISDNGVGIDRNVIDNLFDPYFTLKNTGTGLGLSVCLGIVRRHKGSIRVDSESGKGTVFTVLLPSSG
ncbi:MAG TPA: hypothetical protein DCZ94_21390 [Lentisphaeria bacterium]|nr:MAG: hypothetical protein A2X48_22515 [Lentisphaerae bacterium GWF2_49_21]HBC89499.1 hypothetical protein [Lentisphaeria bacterium]